VKTDFSLQGKSALVTGGTRGIGRAIALRLARAGARVLANHVHDTVSADSLRREAAAENLPIEIVRADITSEKGVNRLLAAMEPSFNPLSIFVHCAATGVHHPIDELTLRQFDWTFSLNVRAFFELVHRLLPRFERGASIVALSSEGAVHAVHQYTLVGASKGALEAMVRHLAIELAPRGIRVNALSPGAIATDAWKALPDNAERLAEAARRSPTGRLTTLEEVAGAAHFLCSDAASGIGGHVLVVDQGSRVRS
jgi:enoyl-[acyl-carrier protein] reductase III